jgi:hypothetical protein
MGVLFAGVVAVATSAPSPQPSPRPSSMPAAAGPCASAPLSSIAVRPGLGRAPASGGAVCVAAPGVVVLGAGYRDQVTVGTTRQTLLVYPAPVALVGLPAQNELIVAPGLTLSRRIGGAGSALTPATGQQDAGLGFQHLLSDRPATQQALEVFATFPTGYPTGPSGFSMGAPTYQLGYTIAESITPAVGATLSNAVVDGSGWTPAGSMRRFVGYQPSLTVSFALTPSTSLLLEDQIAAPTGPQSPTGNRALAGLQQTLSPAFVIDLDYEVNALPAPGTSQHTRFEAGVTVRL